MTSRASRLLFETQDVDLYLHLVDSFRQKYGSPLAIGDNRVVYATEQNYLKVPLNKEGENENEIEHSMMTTHQSAKIVKSKIVRMNGVDVLVMAKLDDLLRWEGHIHSKRFNQESVDPEWILHVWESTEDYDDLHYDELEKTGFWGAAGAGSIIFAESTKRFLVAFRSNNQVGSPHCYATIGGAIDPGETPTSTARREAQEEAGFNGTIVDLIPLYNYTSGKFTYHNFLMVIEDEFKPTTNWETDFFKWVDIDELFELSPKHFGLTALLQNSGDVFRRIAS